MASPISLLYLGILLISAKVGDEIFRRLTLPGFVGSIVAGIIIGPGVLSLVTPSPDTSLFTNLGIDFLLFLAGAEEFVIPSMNRREMGTTAMTSTLHIGVAILVIYFLLSRFGIVSLPLAIVLGMTSAGPLARLLTDSGLSRVREGALIFTESAIIEIMGIVGFSVAVSSTSSYLVLVAEIVGAVIATLVLGRFIFNRVLEVAETFMRSREVLFSLVVALVLISGYIGQVLNFNSALAALILGFLVAEYLKDRRDILERLHAFTYGFFEPLFFAGVGLYFVRIDLQILALGLFIGAIILGSKGLLGYTSSFFLPTEGWKNAWGTAIKGGVDSALLLAALNSNLIDSSVYSFSVISIASVALASPILFRLKTSTLREREEEIKMSMRLSDISDRLLKSYGNENESLRSIVDRMTAENLRAITIVDSRNRPIGFISLHDLIEIEPSRYPELRATDVNLSPVEVLSLNRRIRDAVRVFQVTGVPVIAVVDERGIYVGQLIERELLRLLVVKK